MKKIKKCKGRRIVILAIAMLLPISMYAEDPTLAGLITVNSNAMAVNIAAQNAIILEQAREFSTSKEKLDANTKLINEYNKYLDSFKEVIVYAAELYGLYQEFDHLIKNISAFTGQLSKSSELNVLAVALTPERAKIIRETVLLGANIVNDINKICFSDQKMTEKERMSLAFSIRPQVRVLNHKLVNLTLAVKYTSMSDVYMSIMQKSHERADKKQICEDALDRWQLHARLKY